MITQDLYKKIFYMWGNTIKKYKFLLLGLILLIIESIVLNNGTYQGALPYYISASINELSLSSIRFSLIEINDFYRLDQVPMGVVSIKNEAYRFIESGKVASQEEIINGFGYLVSYGFLVYVKVARFFFSAFGDLRAVVAMNVITHIVVSVIYLRMGTGRIHVILFLILYVFNPLIIKLVTFSYYYYLTVIPSIIFLVVKNKKICKENIEIALLLLALLFSYITRPSTIFGVIYISILLVLLSKKYIPKLLFLISIIFIAVFMLNYDYIYGPWHTIYVGLGAYDNPFNIYISDSSATDYIEKILSIDHIQYQKLSAEVRQGLLKQEVINLLFNSPFMYIRNAIYNLLQLYGFGYKTDSEFFQILSGLVGILYISLCMYYGLFKNLIAIFLLNLGYILFFPPIPLYMAGTYILLINGWIFFITKFFEKYFYKFYTNPSK